MERAMYYLRRDGLYQDLSIVCPGRTFAVHSVVVAPQWYHVHLMCSRFEEPEMSRRIELPDHSFEVDAIIEFCYNGDYGRRWFGPELLYHACIFDIAEKYQLFLLKELALDKFKAAISTAYTGADLATTAKHLYLTEKHELREIFVQAIYARRVELLSRISAFREALLDIPALMEDMVVWNIDGISGGESNVAPR